MAIKIGHAVHSESGGREGESGDQIQQQGKKNEEVQVSKWYVSGDGWEWYIEAKDAALLERMAVLMEQACANPNIGYSRTNRYKWFASAKSNGGDVTLADGDCDCSSLVSGIANLAGSGVTNKLATASMYAAFKKSPNFTIYTDADHLASDKLARRGGIYLRVGHTLMVLEDGAEAVAGIPVADPNVPYVQIIKSVNVRNAPSTSGEVIYIARNEKLPYVSTDPTGWFVVDVPGGSCGFVSCNIPKYAKLVKE